jgi:hypothetical protein
MRRNHLGSTRFWAYELAADDATSGTYASRKARLDEALEQFYKIDSDLKYGNSSEGIVSYITDNQDFYNLWYMTPCPASLNLSDCYGVATLLRRYIDEIALFAATSEEL